MGFFFACFGIKDHDRKKTQLVSKSTASKNRDPLVTKNQLKNVMLCEEDLPSEKERHLSLQENFESADEELKNEVKLLKSCGVLMETPVEIQKASEKSNVIRTTCSDETPSSTSCRKLNWDDQLTDFPESIPESCRSDEHQKQNRIVRFDEVGNNNSANEAVNCVNLNLSPQIENQIKRDASPYPTPLSLSEDMYSPHAMLTPKSVCKNSTMIKTEYAYPIHSQSSDESKEEANLNQETPKFVVPSLSEWLKPPSSKLNLSDERCKTKSSDQSPNADRPIIGLVATHWKENDPTHVSPKWFDGNGIPNSTNKYKEDQKVSWHATPFEERLEKALSDEKFFPKRDLSGRPVNLDDEGEENDTATSKSGSATQWHPSLNSAHNVTVLQ